MISVAIKVPASLALATDATSGGSVSEHEPSLDLSVAFVVTSNAIGREM